jgi:hypothetical protein
MVDAQTIGVLVTASSVTVAAVYYMFTLRTNQRNYKATLETRQAQLFMQLFDRWTSSEFALNYGKARYEICQAEQQPGGAEQVHLPKHERVIQPRGVPHLPPADPVL